MIQFVTVLFIILRLISPGGVMEARSDRQETAARQLPDQREAGEQTRMVFRETFLSM